jgi:hypothetical protein
MGRNYCMIPSHPYRMLPVSPPQTRWTRFKRWVALRCPGTSECHRKAAGGHWEYTWEVYQEPGKLHLPGWKQMNRCTDHIECISSEGVRYFPLMWEDWPEVQG